MRVATDSGAGFLVAGVEKGQNSNFPFHISTTLQIFNYSKVIFATNDQAHTFLMRCLMLVVRCTLWSFVKCSTFITRVARAITVRGTYSNVQGAQVMQEYRAFLAKDWHFSLKEEIVYGNSEFWLVDIFIWIFIQWREKCCVFHRNRSWNKKVTAKNNFDKAAAGLRT